ncbi:hypothetical protein [Sulfobacillus thermosulfidooxidans]|uniref:hypothetical protein n=1 Tax=Sulfobacillus thermosulfidooxidans TaxID=28034 RepID=UPI0006B5CA24|nr:hypothetical protein [Sulfobacillus thermosulfidooxidans]
MASHRIDQNTIETDHWRFEWSPPGNLIIKSKTGDCSHTYQIQGDPHFYMDGIPQFDFPQANCTFVFTDGTVLVAQAPADNQQLRDCHIFAADGKHYPLGQASQFDEQVGWLFVQQEKHCEFYCTAYTPIKNNVGQSTVPIKYQTF